MIRDRTLDEDGRISAMDSSTSPFHYPANPCVSAPLTGDLLQSAREGAI
jgi:hypothetical protein